MAMDGLGLDLGNILAHLRLDDSEYMKKMTRAERRMVQMGEKLTRIGRKMTMRLTAPILALGAVSAKVFASFEKDMAMVSTMLDEQSMHHMPVYEKALLDISMAFGESTKTLSKGLYDILSASVAPVKAMDVLSISVKAAAGGITSTAVAADAITTVLNSYGMAADEAGKVSDILFAIVKRGKTTFGELAPKIGMVTSIAHTAGLSLEELGAAIATMTRAGLQTPIALTAMRGILNSFLKPTEEAIQASEEFGLTLDSVTLSSIGLTGVLAQLKGATAEQLASLFPNIRALAGMAALSGQAGKQLEDLKLMLNSTGLSQEAFEKMTKTLSFAMGQFGATIKVAGISLGEVLAPYIKDVTSYVKKLVRVFIAMNTETKKTVIIFMGIVASIGPMILILGLGMKALGLFGLAVTKITVSVGALMGALFGWLGIVLLLGAAAYSLYAIFRQNIDGIKLIFTQWGEEIKGWIQWFVDEWKDAWDWLSYYVDAFGKWFKEAWTWLGNSVIGKWLNWLVKAFRKTWDTILKEGKVVIADLGSSIWAALDFPLDVAAGGWDLAVLQFEQLKVIHEILCIPQQDWEADKKDNERKEKQEDTLFEEGMKKFYNVKFVDVENDGEILEGKK